MIQFINGLHQHLSTLLESFNESQRGQQKIYHAGESVSTRQQARLPFDIRSGSGH